MRVSCWTAPRPQTASYHVAILWSQRVSLIATFSGPDEALDFGVYRFSRFKAHIHRSLVRLATIFEKKLIFSFTFKSVYKIRVVPRTLLCVVRTVETFLNKNFWNNFTGNRLEVIDYYVVTIVLCSYQAISATKYGEQKITLAV